MNLHILWAAMAASRYVFLRMLAPCAMVLGGGALTAFSADNAFLVTFVLGLAIALAGGWWGIRLLRREGD